MPRSSQASSAPASVRRWGSVKALVSHFSRRTASAPWRMQKARASASAGVVVEKVSEPVSSWMPSANTLASNGVTGDAALGDDAQHQRDQ